MDARIGFQSANLVGRASGFDGTPDWGYHDRLTRERADLADVRQLFDEVVALGVEGVSLWSPHCHYRDPEADPHAVRRAADERGLDVYAYAGALGEPVDGDDAEGWEATFATADRLGCEHLVGSYGDASNREFVREFAGEYGVDFAYENGSESTPGAVRDAVAGFEDCMGVALDTGKAESAGMDPVAAVEGLGPLLHEVHLKDVDADGDSGAYGEGQVDLAGCLDALDAQGFSGWLTVEHEPLDRDPMPEVLDSLDWLGERL